MNYIKRDLERKFLNMSKSFKAVMVTGARQVGKSTMLKHLAEKSSRRYVTMDDSQLRSLAVSDPKLFFQTYKPPILIDEVQKAPELFEQIKIICDESEERGLFWLTGSQSKKLKEKAEDSLSDRLCILNMYSMSQRELSGNEEDYSFSFNPESWMARVGQLPANDIVAAYEHIWRGGMPDVRSMDGEQMHEYYNSYIETYLMRDAVDDNGIKDTEAFRKFLRACAAFTGYLINYKDIAASADISAVTAKEWIHILQSMGIVMLIEPYASNELKRMIKKPKLYFCDTGLCAYLSSWTSRDTLMNGASAGRFYENYVIGEFIRNYAYSKEKANLNFYRDKNQKEIDLIIETDGELHPIEIKRASSPEPKSIKAFRLLENADKKIRNGGIVCMTDIVLPIEEKNYLRPSNII